MAIVKKVVPHQIDEDLGRLILRYYRDYNISADFNATHKFKWTGSFYSESRERSITIKKDMAHIEHLNFYGVHSKEGFSHFEGSLQFKCYGVNSCKCKANDKILSSLLIDWSFNLEPLGYTPFNAACETVISSFSLVPIQSQTYSLKELSNSFHNPPTLRWIDPDLEVDGKLSFGNNSFSWNLATTRGVFIAIPIYSDDGKILRFNILERTQKMINHTKDDLTTSILFSLNNLFGSATPEYIPNNCIFIEKKIEVPDVVQVPAAIQKPAVKKVKVLEFE